MQSISFFYLAAGLLGLSQWAAAQTPSVTSRLTAHEVEMVAGKTVLNPATVAKPGDLVQYSATYSNGGNSAVNALMATIPVPVGTTLQADSAQPPAGEGSTDGVHFSALPLMHGVRGADGHSREEPVALGEYRALRWAVGTLDAHKNAQVSLRVRIDPPLHAAKH